jgi:DNA-directed RNA polymerase specialized sigma24 family protein
MVAITLRDARDPVLSRWIEARDDEERREQLDRLLVDRARPLIASVLARFAKSDRALGGEEADDVTGTVILRLMRKLQNPEALTGEAIRDFDGYVATLTYRTIYDVMRQRFPERTRLKNRIRYLLGHDPRFAVWTAGDGVVCGLRAWEGRADAVDTLVISRGMASRVMLDRERPHDAVAAIFERAGRPRSLESLVRIVAELWDVVEIRAEAPDDQLAASSPGHAVRFETRQFLESLWNEIRQLPENQRAALLLNLRDADGVNAVALILFVGIARIEEIAEVMSLRTEELMDLWDELPLDDHTIAARLRVTRQQVINLRRAARERLSRRTSGYDRRAE